MTLLRQAIALDNLRLAWEEVAENKGIPGVDRITIKRWGRNWEARLHQLADDVRRGRYKPRKLRRRWIPKKNRREMRELRIPTVTDRVLQRAVLQVMNLLLDFGTPVQYSVFECWLDKEEQKQLKRAVKRIVRPKKQDHVRFYRLCAACVEKIETLGGADVTGEPPPALVIGDAEGG